LINDADRPFDIAAKRGPEPQMVQAMVDYQWRPLTTATMLDYDPNDMLVTHVQ
jgi:hypothetical protein